MCDRESSAYKAGYNNIAQIGIDRLRNVNKKFKKENKNYDNGFRVYKLSKSSFNSWDDYEGVETKELEQRLELFNTPLIKGWKRQDLIPEILLIEGFSIDSKIEKSKKFTKNEVQEISSEFCNHKILICLDEKIETETITALVMDKNDIFVCFDSAISDQVKMRLSDLFKLKTI
jgi:adenine-specific DNA-methyltransferase